ARGQGRLQGPGAAAPVHVGPRQDSLVAGHGYLPPVPAQGRHGDQVGTRDGAPALPRQMKLILTQDVADLGLRGDVVDVADGYARNYLVPRALGMKATRGALKDAEKIRATRLESDRKVRESAEDMAQVLTGTTVVVAARAADEGRLFGSIGVRDVAEAI